MNGIFEGLNPAQRKAVEHISGPSLVIAGAGSGKTRVLTCRIANLLAHNIPSHTILALTFTNKAAREMKERIATLVGEDAARNLWMGTFHSIFAKILRFESQVIGFSSHFTIYDTQDSRSLIAKIISDLKLDKELYKPAAVAARISKAKNNLITAQSYAQNIDALKKDRYEKMPEIHAIYSQYQVRCKKSDAMDFDDLLLYTNILFRDNIEVLEKYCNKFRYILVDEYQDTNFAQYLIVKKLALPQNNVCVVGDDAQSIYSFRGAKIENILKFSKDYPQYALFKLEQNYRSTQTIVDAANSVIKKNKTQIPKKTFSEQEKGGHIKVCAYQTDFEEGMGVAREIQNLHSQNAAYKDIAILYRTNAQSRILEESLTKLRIPSRIYGGTGFFQRKEIKDILAYVRVCVNPKDEEAISRIINYPARGIGQTTIDKIQKLAFSAQYSIWDVIANIELASDFFNKGTITKIKAFHALISELRAELSEVDAYNIMHRIIEKSGIYSDLKSDTSLEGKNRFDNLQELLNGVKDFVEKEEDEGVLLTDYLEKISLLTDVDTDTDASDKVTLMTVHSAKGLEFSHCFIVGLEEQLFPSFMGGETPESTEEERRLFYVALTRAKTTAYLTYAHSRRKWGNLTNSSLSRFVQEIDPTYIEEISSGFSTSFSSSPQSTSFQQFMKKKEGAAQKPAFQQFKKTAPSPIVADFEPDNPRDITSQSWVLHAKFGKGFVQSMYGEFPESTAVIDFENGEQKKLLLKFAKLKRL